MKLMKNKANIALKNIKLNYDAEYVNECNDDFCKGMKENVSIIQQVINNHLTVEEIELLEFMSTSMKSKACFNENTKKLYENMKVKLQRQKEIWK